MEFLVFWTKLSAAATVLSVQPMMGLSCQNMRAAVLHDGTIDHAVCLQGEQETIAFVARRDCSAMQEGRNFSTFVCTKG